MFSNMFKGANVAKGRGTLELKKFAVYLVVPVACVYLYHHELLNPYLARHTPLYPPSDPNDNEVELAMQEGFRLRAARIEKQKKKEEAKAAKAATAMASKQADQ